MDAKTYIIAIFVAVLVFASGFWCGVHYHPATAAKVREQLNHITDKQQDIDEQIGSIATDLKETDGVLTECIHILRQVRRQPATETSAE